MQKLAKILKLIYLAIGCIFIKVPNRVLVCLSVDCDGHGYKLSIPEGHKWLFQFYSKLGLEGKITYFVNEKYKYTKLYPQILKEILERGDRIELHSHYEKLVFEEKYQELKNEIEKEYIQLSDFCKDIDPSYKIKCFRSGSHARSITLFKVLKELNIKCDSSLLHNQKINVYGYEIDDSDTPLNCYYSDPINFKKTSENKTILEIPVWQPLPDLRSIKKYVNPNEPVIITVLIHPFNIYTEKKNIIGVLFYKFCVWCLRKINNVEFMRLDKAIKEWEKWKDSLNYE